LQASWLSPLHVSATDPAARNRSRSASVFQMAKYAHSRRFGVITRMRETVGGTDGNGSAAVNSALKKRSPATRPGDRHGGRRRDRPNVTMWNEAIIGTRPAWKPWR